MEERWDTNKRHLGFFFKKHIGYFGNGDFMEHMPKVTWHANVNGHLVRGTRLTRK
jgi:hypothetical protein